VSRFAALLLRQGREFGRRRLTRIAALIFVIGLVAVAVRAPGSDSLWMLAALLGLALLAAGAAAGAGTTLPDDRVSGREAWLATLAPAAWQRRAAIALGAWTRAVGIGALGGALLGAVAGSLDPFALRTSETLAVKRHGVIRPAGQGAEGGPAWRVRVPPGAEGRILEVDVRPLFARTISPIDRVAFTWAAGGEHGVAAASVRGPLRVPVPAGGGWVDVALRTPDVTMRVRAADVLGAPVGDLRAFFLLGLLVGLSAGAAGPLAVLVSRATTGQTAAAAAFCLLLFGVVKAPLLTLAADLDLEGTAAVAATVLRGLARLAPDLALLERIGDAVAGRAPGAAALPGALPAVLYAAVGLVLAALPLPRGLREGANA
jgi:hypothetical protein